MIAVIVICLLVIAGLIAWDRFSRVPPVPHSPQQTGSPPWTGPSAQREARKPAQATAPPRFQGRGVATGRDARAERGGGAPARRTGPRFSPASTATPRFSGEVRRSPDAIGLACGRPIAECDRGADCLCVD
jgi:hypothetical protein